MRKLRWGDRCKKYVSLSMGLSLSFCFQTTLGQTNFYSNATGSLSAIATWGTSTDGTGTHPPNFTNDGQIFNIRNNAAPTIGSNWTVSGVGSKIIVGDGINPTNFTIPSGKSVSGVIDVSAGATLTNSSGSAISLGIVASTSTIVYNQTSAQTVVPVTYGNLVIGGSGNKTMGGSISVNGALSLNSGPTLVIAAGTVLTLSGTLINNGAGITGSTTSSLNINSTAGINVTLPALSLQNVTIDASDTIVLAGDLNLNGLLAVNGTFDAGVAESQVRNGGSGSVIISGKFITRDIDGFTGTNASIPSINPTISAGSTIEFARSGDQKVSNRSDYSNLMFSGTGIKTLATFRPIGTVTIKDNAVVDASNRTFGDTTATNLTMTGGRFIVAGIGNKPDIAGSYNLTGGVIEFAGGTTSSRQNIRSAPTYVNIEVTGLNVGNSNSSTKLADGGVFAVKAGGSYENSGDKIDGTAGSQTFIMEAGATFKTGVSGGLSGSSSAALNNIETITIDPKSTIIYSRADDQTITPLTNGYPTLLLKGKGIKTVATGTLTVATTADSIAIDPSVVFKVSSGAKANFNNVPVFIHSNASGTGMIGEITDGASALTNTTNVTVERYIPARRAFRFLSSPVTTTSSIKANWMEGQSNPPPAYSVNNNSRPGYGTHITGSADPADGFDATATNNPSMFTFNGSSQLWEAVPNTSGILTSGGAYRLLVRGSRSVNLSTNNATPSNTILRTNGTLQTGSIVFNTNSTPAIDGNVNNYSFVGNPYASSVNWDALSKTGLSSYYTVWDPTLNTRGAYVTYGNGITSTPGSAVDQNIQSGQAFFVQTTSANPSLTFNETNKTTTIKSVFKTSVLAPLLSVQLLLDTLQKAASVADGAVVFFDESLAASTANNDALKMRNLDENLYIESAGRELSINGRASLKSNDTVQILIDQFRQKAYYLQLSPANFPASASATLIDDYLKKDVTIDLHKRSSYRFEILGDPMSFDPHRFKIVFKTANALPISFTGLKAVRSSARIELSWNVPTDRGVSKYDIEKLGSEGSFEKRATLNRNQSSSNPAYNWYDSIVNPGNNCYRIRCVEESGLVTYSNEVCVNISDTKSAVTVSSSPLHTGVINISMNNTAAGNYNITVFNNLGQKVYGCVLHHDNRQSTYQLSTQGIIASGICLVMISNGEQTYVRKVMCP